MAARLAVAERELLTAKREIIEKDSKIQELEKRLSLRVAPPLPPSTHQLEMKCSALQRQVEEMEVLLSPPPLATLSTTTCLVSGVPQGLWDGVGREWRGPEDRG